MSDWLGRLEVAVDETLGIIVAFFILMVALVAVPTWPVLADTMKEDLRG